LRSISLLLLQTCILIQLDYMEFRFDRILIPVDFSNTTEVAINKALKLVDGPDSLICLLHISKPRRLGLHWLKNNSAAALQDSIQQSLQSWKEYIEQNSSDVKVIVAAAESSDLEKQIILYARHIEANLVILGRQNRHGWLSIADSITASRLSPHIQIPVLTVMPAALHQETRTVVLPIDFSTSEKKLELMQALARKFRMHIHLVTLIDNDKGATDALATSFLETFGWLKQHLHCQVEYNFIKGPNIAKALVQYCVRVNADLLLVYPDNTARNSWSDQQICDLFPSNSKTQILTV